MPLVQTSGLKETDTFANSTTYTTATNFTAGNTVILALIHYNGPSTDITGVTASGTAMVRDATITAGNYRIDIWRASNVAGGSSAVVINVDAGGTHIIACSFEEWSGFQATPLDQTATQSGAAATTITVTTLATTVADEVVYALFCDLGNYGAANAVTPDGTYTVTFENELVGKLGGYAGYKTVAATGAQSATITVATADTLRGAIATYKLSAAGSAVTSFLF